VLAGHRPSIDRILALQNSLFQLSPDNFELRANVILDSAWFTSNELIKGFVANLLVVC
jgi:hypothetical protein